VITEVCNQKTCGACWAFSTAATIEAMYAIKTGKLHKLSVQEVSILLRASLHWYAVICMSGLLYRGVTKCFWTELMTICLHTFVFVGFVGCCPLPVCATGPDFLQLFVVLAKLTSWTCLLDCQWLRSVLVAAVTFPDARRIYGVKLSE